MEPLILFRAGTLDEHREMAEASKHFEVVTLRSEIPFGRLVIPRFSALPYYKELEADTYNMGSLLINSFHQHRWIADFEYYEAFEGNTPTSWTEAEFPYSDHQGPFVVKGKTNSRKQRWSTHMYAETRRDAVRIAHELAIDPLIGPQGIIYREFMEFESYGVDPVSGIPITNEWRFFCYKGAILSYDFYWTNTEEEGQMDWAGLESALIFAGIASHYCNFFVLDIARDKDGRWWLVEINDGSQAGIHEDSADEMYKELAYRLLEEGKE